MRTEIGGGFDRLLKKCDIGLWITGNNETKVTIAKWLWVMHKCYGI